MDQARRLKRNTRISLSDRRAKAGGQDVPHCMTKKSSYMHKHSGDAASLGRLGHSGRDWCTCRAGATRFAAVLLICRWTKRKAEKNPTGPHAHTCRSARDEAISLLAGGRHASHPLADPAASPQHHLRSVRASRRLPSALGM